LELGNLFSRKIKKPARLLRRTGIITPKKPNDKKKITRPGAPMQTVAPLFFLLSAALKYEVIFEAKGL